MHFIPGQTVVHPHHGPATVLSISVRTIKNIESRYLVLRIHDQDLTVGLPAESAESIGLRTVFSRTEIGRLLEVMRAPTEFEESQWSRRMKAAQEKLNSGDIFAVAEVVRNLLRRSRRGQLSNSEKLMLKQAKRPLVTEVRLSLDLEAAEAENLIDALPGGSEGDPGQPTGAAGTPERGKLLAV